MTRKVTFNARNANSERRSFMTRMTLLASVATLVAAPAFADNHMSEDGANQNMQNGEQTAQTDQNQSGQQSDTEMAQDDAGENQMMNDGSQYASGTMDSNQLGNMIRTSEITGGDVYAVDRNEWTDQEWADTEVFDEVGADWEDIGNITDVVLSPDGQRAGLVVSHGGFLDIGDDTVLLTMDEVRRIGSTEDVGGDFNYVTRLTEEEIEQMPEVEENWW